MLTFKFISRPKSEMLVLRIITGRRKSEISYQIRLSEMDLANALSNRPLPHNANIARILKEHGKQLEIIKHHFLFTVGNEPLLEDVRDMVVRQLFPGVLPKEERLRAEYEERMRIREEQERLAREKRLYLCPFYEKVIEERVSTAYRENMRYTLNTIKEYPHGGEDLKISDISTGWLKGFDSYLAKTGLSVNSRAIHFRNLRTVINRAIDEDIISAYPFRRFRIKTEETRKRSLTVEALRNLLSYPVEPHQEFHRDMFALTFMLCGINAADLYKLTEVTENGRVEYRRSKTKKLYSIKVEPEARYIIEKYRGHDGNLLCLSDRWTSVQGFLKAINKNLQTIGPRKKVAGRGGKYEISPLHPELTTYWARHSWATIANTIDIPKDTIAAALGHEVGNRITGVYIDFDRNKIDEANRRVLDWVLYGKK